MPNTKSVVHFLLVDFGGGYLVVTCDGGKTKSTPSLTDLDCTVRLDWSLTTNNSMGLDTMENKLERSSAKLRS